MGQSSPGQDGDPSWPAPGVPAQVSAGRTWRRRWAQLSSVPSRAAPCLTRHLWHLDPAPQPRVSSREHWHAPGFLVRQAPLTVAPLSSRGCWRSPQERHSQVLCRGWRGSRQRGPQPGCAGGTSQPCVPLSPGSADKRLCVCDWARGREEERPGGTSGQQMRLRPGATDRQTCGAGRSPSRSRLSEPCPAPGSLACSA